MNAINKNFINLVNLSKFGGPGPAVFLDTIDSVSDMLQEIGYQTKISSNVILNDAINILWGVGSVFSPSYEEVAAIATPKNTIIFNMEQLGSESTLVTDEYLNFISKYIILDYNQHNLDILSTKNKCDGYEFPILPSKKFMFDYPYSNSIQKQYDLAFYGILNERREELIRKLASSDISVKIISGKYGAELSSALLDCKFVLNLHYFESAIFEVARSLRPLAMGIPIISEASIMPKFTDWSESGIIFEEYANLPKLVIDTINNVSRVVISNHKLLKFLNNNDHKNKVKEIIYEAINKLN
jgi:hypothetical protein